MSLKKIFRKKVDGSPKDDHWIPLSDLMTGLMMVFMLIAILYMVQLQQEKKKALPTPTPTASPTPTATPAATPTPLPAIVAVATKYADTKSDLYNDLFIEFHNDLPKWKANIDEKSLSIRFEEPDVLFDTGQSILKKSFKNILNDFFPRYIRILTKPQYSTTIEEIRIEGHTSSQWNGSLNPDDAYSKNMDLSQSRTRATLSYVLTLPDIQSKKEWMISHFTANGLSSSHIRKNDDGTENPLLSQRVEFKVKANADEIISEMATYSGK